MLKWLFEALAPAIFTKGIYSYHKGDYYRAHQLLRRAARWMPELSEDGLYYAYELLIKFHLNKDASVDSVRMAIEKMRESKLRVHTSAKKAERELNHILEQISLSNTNKGEQH